MPSVPEQPETESTEIRLQTPDDLIATLPYLMGYRVEQSLVLVALSDEIVDAVIRYDLPEPSQDASTLAGEGVRLLTRKGASRVALVGFGPGERVTPLMDAFSQALAQQNIDIIDMIRCENGRYWSYLCSDPICCPPDGKPYDPISNPTAAQAVMAGLVALPGKVALRQSLLPVQGQDRETMTAATATARARAEALLNAPDLDQHYWFEEGLQYAKRCYEHVRDGRPIPAQELAWLGVLLTGILVRDIAFTVHREYGVDVARSLWTEVTRRVDQAYAAAPATILAFLALHNGEGSLARFAAERALEIQPDYPFARLIIAALPYGIPLSDPDTELSAMAREITEQAARTPQAAKPVIPGPLAARAT